MHPKSNAWHPLRCAGLPALLAVFGAMAPAHAQLTAQPAAQTSCAADALPQRAGHFLLNTAAGRVVLPADLTQRPGDGLPAADLVIRPAGSAARPSAPLPVPPMDSVQAETLRFASALMLGQAGLALQGATWRRRDFSILVSMAEGAPSSPLAVLVVEPTARKTSSEVEPAPDVSWVELAPASTAAPDPLRAVALQEALYTLVFRQDPLGRYCPAATAGPCAEGSWMTQGQALLQIAQRRACALSALPDALRGQRPAWQSVSVKARSERRNGRPWAWGRLTANEVAIPGQRIVFSMQPHSTCHATTDGEGSASCELIDQHGHDEDGDESASVPVVATFPGAIGAQRVLLPTSTLAPAAR